MSGLFALTLLLSGPQQVTPGPPIASGGASAGEVEAGVSQEPSKGVSALWTGPVLSGDLQSGPAFDRWLRRELHVHALTHFEIKQFSRDSGGGVVLMREHFQGIPIAGARLALRLDRDRRLRQVVGQAMSRDARLVVTPMIEAGELAPAAAFAGASVDKLHRRIWWPTANGLIAAHLVDDPISIVEGRPVQLRRAVSYPDGRQLASWSILDEGDLPIVGWPENPVLTPQGELYSVEVFDSDPVYLQNDFVRIVECHWSEELKTCDPQFGPAGDPTSGWQSMLPELDDEQAHRAVEDVWAGPNTMQLAMRFVERLESWGWSREVWDVIDCEWQAVPVEECQLWLRNNVLAQDDDGVFPFAGAYYSTASGIYMGQGVRADTSFDGDIVIHEIGHHVTRSYGTPEPTGIQPDRSRRLVDRSSINEGSSDFFARQMSSNDLIYDYFTTLEPGNYIDDRTRDLSIPFRCPENLTGEVHMDGRIWVSALREAQQRLSAQGIAQPDEFMSTFLLAMAAFRQIPTEDYEQFPEAIEILIDEFSLSHGNAAAAIVRSVFDERGLRVCHRTLDVRENPNNDDPDGGASSVGDPLDARFMYLSSWGANTDPEKVFASPPAPPVHHVVTLGANESSLQLRYRPRLWRPAREDTPTPPFVGTLLVKQGPTEIAFWHNPTTGYRENDADFRVDAEAQDEEGWGEVTLTGLEPGEQYQLAFASLTAISGDAFVIENMIWEIGDEPAGQDETGETESDGGLDAGELGTAGEESDEAASATDEGGRANEAGVVTLGCACSNTPTRGDANWAWMSLLLGVPAWRRRRSSGRASLGQAAGSAPST